MVFMSNTEKSAAPFSLLGLDHVVLRVANMERAIRFYCDLLGCIVERSVEALGLVQLRAGASLIDLVNTQAPLGKKGGDAPGKNAHNMDHFCIRIEPFEEETLRQFLINNGVRTDEVGQRYGADGYGPSLYIRDPDGNTVELKGPSIDAIS